MRSLIVILIVVVLAGCGSKVQSEERMTVNDLKLDNKITLEEVVSTSIMKKYIACYETVMKGTKEDAREYVLVTMLCELAVVSIRIKDPGVFDRDYKDPYQILIDNAVDNASSIRNDFSRLTPEQKIKFIKSKKDTLKFLQKTLAKLYK